jgi:hypothetical protein
MVDARFVVPAAPEEAIRRTVKTSFRMGLRYRKRPYSGGRLRGHSRTYGGAPSPE